MSYELAVSTKRLGKTFNGKEVIRSCNMSVEKGTIYGFVGKNGAGKTTLIRVICGLQEPSSGTYWEKRGRKNNGHKNVVRIVTTNSGGSNCFGA